MAVDTEFEVAGGMREERKAMTNPVQKVEQPKGYVVEDMWGRPNRIFDECTVVPYMDQQDLEIADLKKEVRNLQESLQMRTSAYRQRDEKEEERANAAKRSHHQRKEINRLESEKSDLKRKLEENGILVRATEILARQLQDLARDYKHAVCGEWMPDWMTIQNAARAQAQREFSELAKHKE